MKGGAVRQRMQTALVGIPLGLALIYLGGWYLTAAVALLAVLGIGEFCRLVQVEDRYHRIVGALFAVGIVVSSFLLGAATYPYVGVGLVVLAVLDRTGMALGRHLERPIPGLIRQTAAVWLGFLYVPFLFGFLVQLRNLEAKQRLPDWFGNGHEGATWLALVITTCWAVDTAAYFVGRALGRHKLAPKISPGKTVEGGLAGLAAAVVWAGGFGMLLGLTLPQAVLLGALLGVGGQVGDLFESLLKRRAGVKDSGTLLPGHGGVLDRFDSLLFCAPIAFGFLYAIMR